MCTKLGIEKKFWCIGIEKIRKVLTSDSNVVDILAVLEFDNFDIELTDRGFFDGKRYYDYFCCKKLNGKWHSFDVVNFGNKKPYEFSTAEELKEDMRLQLEIFLENYNM